MAHFVQMFGNDLCSAQGSVNTAATLEGKVVAIYFSAHWCPPCRGFTPKLAEWYTNDLASKGLEVVFVSSDNSEEEFKEYFQTMPWKAMPYSERSRKAALSKQFKVQGIPTLIILDADGSLICRDGRTAVSQDPKGENFPWRPKPFHEVLGSSFVGQGGKKLNATAVEGKVLGLYFSAHWCPPCRMFTPELAAWYKKVSANLPDFEIVFVSSDRDQESFEEYFAEMPWIALDYAERKRKEELSTLFEVEGIPTFVIVGKDGTVITTNGRSIPSSDPEGKEFPWHPKPVQNLADPEGINDTPSLVVLADGVDDAKRKAVGAALDQVAAEWKLKVKESGGDDILFFVDGPGSERVLGQIRQLTNQPVADTVTGVLLDFDDEASYYVANDVDFTNPASIKGFLERYQAKSLQKQSIQR